jgi:hypothetical protein
VTALQHLERDRWDVARSASQPRQPVTGADFDREAGRLHGIGEADRRRDLAGEQLTQIIIGCQRLAGDARKYRMAQRRHRLARHKLCHRLDRWRDEARVKGMRHGEPARPHPGALGTANDDIDRRLGPCHNAFGRTGLQGAVSAA